MIFLNYVKLFKFHSKIKIFFPERVVLGVRADFEDLSKIIIFSSRIAEIRKMSTPVSFFYDLDNYEQKMDWGTI